MSEDIFRFPNSILLTKEYLLYSEYDEKQYPAFFVNRALSQHIDCLMLANEMNMHSDLSNRMQYDYFFHGVRKMKRKYGKWGKRKADDDLQTIVDYYNYSVSKAREVKNLFLSDQLKQMKESMETGG